MYVSWEFTREIQKIVHVAFLTPFNSPAKAFRRNWYWTIYERIVNFKKISTYPAHGEFTDDTSTPAGFRTSVLYSGGTCVFAERVKLQLSLMPDLRG
jgi:hypothetical protein